MIPAVISATVLPRLHPRAAAELYLTGDTFDGARAAEIGLVTAAVPADELDAAVARVLRRRWSGARRGRWPATKAAAAPRGRPADLRDELAELSELLGRLLRLGRGPRGRRGVPGEARPARWVPRRDR